MNPLNSIVGSIVLGFIIAVAIALGIAQEQQAARWMGQGAKPSGMLTTDQKLSPDAAKRLQEDFKQNVSGMQNSGKVIVGESGLHTLLGRPRMPCVGSGDWPRRGSLGRIDGG